jgi:hypothetical protein
MGTFNESEMALFHECTLYCARNPLLETSKYNE